MSVVDDQPQVQQVDAAESPLPRLEVPTKYKVAVAIVSFVMVLLPAVYLVLTVLACWGLYWHLTENVSIFDHLAHSRLGLIIAVAVYAGPIIPMFILVLTMLRNLLPRRAGHGIMVVDPQTQPRLYEHVDRVAKLVGAPVPRAIFLDLDANAAAGPLKGFFSFYGGNLVLTIGMPLLAGMTVRQLTGVIAHELGHFSQQAGMRAGFVIRRVNYWFERIVNDRGGLERAVDRGLSSRYLTALLICGIAKAILGLARLVGQGLMYVGMAVSGFLSRQMEFDADRQEARVAGSECFAGTFERIAALDLAWADTNASLAQAWHDRQVCDDIPDLLGKKLEALGQERLGRATAKMRYARTKWLDTHPSLSDRVRNVQEVAAAGVIVDDRPARELLSDYTALCKEFSSRFYKLVVGPAPAATPQKPAPGSPAGAKASTQAKSASDEVLSPEVRLLTRYCQHPYVAALPLQPMAAAGLSDDQAAEAILEARTALPELLGEFRRASRSHAKAAQRLIECEQAYSLMAVGVELQAGMFPAVMDMRTYTTQKESARGDIEEGRSALTSFAGAVARRLGAAIALLQGNGATDLAGRDVLRDEAVRLAQTMDALAARWEELDSFIRLAQGLSVLGRVKGGDKRLRQSKDAKKSIVYGKLESLLEFSKSLPAGADPLAEPLRRVLAKKPVSELFSADVAARAIELVGALDALSSACLVRLCEIAEQVEASLGLAPLPEPPKVFEQPSEPQPEPAADAPGDGS
jgi:Zn-dependent protease with chaperone function